MAQYLIFCYRWTQYDCINLSGKWIIGLSALYNPPPHKILLKSKLCIGVFFFPREKLNFSLDSQRDLGPQKVKINCLVWGNRIWLSNARLLLHSMFLYSIDNHLSLFVLPASCTIEPSLQQSIGVCLHKNASIVKARLTWKPSPSRADIIWHCSCPYASQRGYVCAHL